MRKAIYKGGNLPIIPGTICNIRLIWDNDCEYVYVYCENIKCVYDGKTQMEREWQFDS